MHSHVSRRRIVLVTVLAAVSCCATAVTARAASTTLAGNWSGKYSGAFSGTFTLHWTQSGSRLNGTIALSNPPGRYGISGSVGRGGAIHFGVVKVGATYTGTAVGTSMSGKYRTPQGGGSWSAHKS